MANRSWNRRSRLIVTGLALVIPSWAVLWTQTWYLNPLFFVTLWTGATLVMYGLGAGYPGVRRHALLALLSIPVWWWFELVNERVANWQYVEFDHYSTVAYAIFATISFATVVPALDAAWGLFGARTAPAEHYERRSPAALPLVVMGVLCHLLLFAFPSLFFPLVWIGPLLIFAGIASWFGGRTLTGEGRWRWSTALRVAYGGLMCGFLWEMWNYWATPSWEYNVPHVGFLHVFAMPLLGYGGYIPFAWSIYLLVGLGPLAQVWRVERRRRRQTSHEQSERSAA